MALATPQDLHSAIDSLDFQELFDRMKAYVKSKIYSKDLKLWNGLEDIDIVSSVFDKALRDVRKWDMSKVSIESFLFGVLKSEVFEFRRKNHKDNVLFSIEDVQLGASDMDNIYAGDFEESRGRLVSDFENVGSDVIEIMILECWLDDYYKPQEISEFLEISVAEVNAGVKRLKRKRIKVKEEWISLKVK
jgi:DNA-directed RNA polymerase specialized sigma24 family protein